MTTINSLQLRNTDDAVMMFDLQIARRANPSTELNYFLASGVSPEFKLQHENGLLAEYHRALSDRLSAYGFPDTTYTVDDVRRDYMSKSTLAFVFGILHSQVRGRERGEREQTLLRTVCTHSHCMHSRRITYGRRTRSTCRRSSGPSQRTCPVSWPITTPRCGGRTRRCRT